MKSNSIYYGGARLLTSRFIVWTRTFSARADARPTKRSGFGIPSALSESSVVQFFFSAFALSYGNNLIQ
ncbi:MAG: hypothetical protein DME26_02605 [Verrucomicrobia bacterium]|nr:MAG: hypothetical protein DME26_02605 [Verrucomicrobiota bacterium]